MMDKDGYHELPGSRQWTSGMGKPVNKARWQPCESCGKAVPVATDWAESPDGYARDAGTVSYVCPFCNHCHVGTPYWSRDAKLQKVCHACETELGGNDYQCPNCSFPRGWMRVDCPYCSNNQPVHAPHWVVHCDMFTLECVECKTVFNSLCIC